MPSDSDDSVYAGHAHFMLCTHQSDKSKPPALKCSCPDPKACGDDRLNKPSGTSFRKCENVWCKGQLQEGHGSTCLSCVQLEEDHAKCSIAAGREQQRAVPLEEENEELHKKRTPLAQRTVENRVNTVDLSGNSSMRPSSTAQMRSMSSTPVTVEEADVLLNTSGSDSDSGGQSLLNGLINHRSPRGGERRGTCCCCGRRWRGGAGGNGRR